MLEVGFHIQPCTSDLLHDLRLPRLGHFGDVVPVCVGLALVKADPSWLAKHAGAPRVGTTVGPCAFPRALEVSGANHAERQVAVGTEKWQCWWCLSSDSVIVGGRHN